MDLRHLKPSPSKKRQALFGLRRAALGELLAQVLPELRRRRQTAQAQRPARQRAVGGGRHRGLKPAQAVWVTVVYWRHTVAHAVVGALFGVSAATAENTFQAVVFVLRAVCPAPRWDAETRGQKGAPRWTPDTVERALMDSCASPVSRPSRPDRQKRGYAGKTKRHPRKRQVVTAAPGDLLALDPGQRGPTADKRLYEQSPVEEYYPKAAKPGD
jgi:hypothetical protein